MRALAAEVDAKERELTVDVGERLDELTPDPCAPLLDYVA